MSHHQTIKSINEMLAQANEAAAADINKQVQLYQQQQATLTAKHQENINILEKKLNASKGDQHRMESNFSRLLDQAHTVAQAELAAAEDEKKKAEVMASQAASEAEAANATATASAEAAAASSARVEELEAQRNSNSLSSIAEKMLTGEELERANRIRSLNQAGARAGAGEVGAKRLTDVASVVGSTIGVVLNSTPLGQSRPAQVLQAIAERRDGSSTVAGKALRQYASANSAVNSAAVRELSNAWQLNMKIGNKSHARSLLSLLVKVEGLRDADITEACSYRPELEVGDHVFVKVTGNYRRCAKVVSMTSTEAVVAGPNLSAENETVPLTNVLRFDAIECTHHQVDPSIVNFRFRG